MIWTFPFHTLAASFLGVASDKTTEAKILLALFFAFNLSEQTAINTQQ